ncbi:chaperone protein ClpB1-like isoform X2 [Cornus florida]|uniref:chaperone protein ClpB1-like isoform X2 n=1 Tax=Cornus florida TaxID=4283 RepID=UPI0028A11C0C|nr:chaperone protein ClpB1-like isoform X2 [Cornus florida]
MDFWDGFVEKWKPLLMQQGSAERAQEIFIMEQLRSGLVSYLQEVEAAKKRFQYSSVVLDLSDDLSSLVNSTCKRIKENATVKPYTVAEGIGQRLRKRFGGQDHVIDAVTNALLSCLPHESRHHPIGSFLFFGGAPYGRPEFIEALTEELFDSKDLLVRFEMSDYSDSHCSQCDSFFVDVRTRDYNHEEHGIRGELIKVVKSRPFGVILFENVEKANNHAIETLLDILRHGRLTDSQGDKVDFTNMLIIMTSDVVMNNVPLWCCDCLEKDQYRPMKCRLKHYCDVPIDHMCGFLHAYLEADKWFQSKLLEELDDVVVFNGLSELHCHVIARLQLRELTEAMRPRRLIVYPSEAALRSITRRSFCRTARREGMKMWLKENVVPVVFNLLAENKTSDGITTIYIDTLVGTDELCYRMEKSPVNFFIFMHFKESLNELRMIYKKEKERACKIYTLKRKYFELITMDSGEDLVHVVEGVQDLVDTVDDIEQIQTSTLRAKTID